MNAILERRTIRRFRRKQLCPEELKKIVLAGLWAPGAGGRQSPLLPACQNPEINECLGKINRGAFGKANSVGIRFVSKYQKSIADDDVIKGGFYESPTVVTLFAPKAWVYAAQDCAAAKSMCLAAWSLGIGACHVGRAGERQISENGIASRYKACACLCQAIPTESRAGTEES